MSLTENVRGSVSEMSGSYERLPILEYGERKEIWNGQHPQRMYQTCKGWCRSISLLEGCRFVGRIHLSGVSFWGNVLKNLLGVLFLG